MYDMIIVGAGTAGLTAGIYALRSGVKPLILECEAMGGQITLSPCVENYPGSKDQRNGVCRWTDGTVDKSWR